MSRTFLDWKTNSGRSVSYKACRKLLINNKAIRSLVKDWYDGPLTDLCSFEGRFMLRRLVVRAHNELVALRWAELGKQKTLLSRQRVMNRFGWISGRILLPF